MTKYVDLRFVFDEETELDHTSYSLVKVKFKDSDISKPDRDTIGERLAQSDFGWIDMPNSVMVAIGGSVTDDVPCASYAEWNDGHREYCTRPAGHEGAHEKEFGGPGAWWTDNVYYVGKGLDL